MTSNTVSKLSICTIGNLYVPKLGDLNSTLTTYFGILSSSLTVVATKPNGRGGASMDYDKVALMSQRNG